MAETAAQRRTRTRDERDATDSRCYGLRLTGANYADIGRTVGIATGSAYVAVQREHARRAPSDEEVRQARDLDLARIDRLLMEAWAIATGSGAAKDKLSAIDTSAKLMERRAKMLGYDAPTKITGEVEFRGMGVDDLVTQFQRVLGKKPQVDEPSNN